MTWDRERALDECQDEMDLAAYDVRCTECGACYAHNPQHCLLCGCEDLEPIEDLLL